MSGELLLVEPLAGGCLRSSVDVELLELLLVRPRRLRRRAHALHLIMVRLNLRLLFRGQHVEDLRHHLRVRYFQLNLNLRSRFGCGSKCGFIESTGRHVALLLVQRPHLIEQGFITLAEALLNLLNLRSLIVSQIQLATERSERSEALARSAGSLRASAKTPLPHRSRSHRPRGHPPSPPP